MPLSAQDLVRILSLEPLPAEGGFFRETYRSDLVMPGEVLPPTYSGPRSAGTGIYYLLTPATFSALHRLRGDEMYHFYLGDPVEMLLLHADGTGMRLLIGSDIGRGMRPQVPVPAGTWQGSRLVSGGRFALLGTTMAPGFDARDFELASRRALLAEFPGHASMITALTAADP
jgi:hypothetical protein